MSEQAKKFTAKDLMRSHPSKEVCEEIIAYFEMQNEHHAVKLLDNSWGIHLKVSENN